LRETECVETLLARGATINLPAAIALDRRDLCLRLMQEDPDCLKPGHRWDRLIHIASGCAGADVVENLVAAGQSVHSRTNSKAFGTKNYTPLHDAAWAGNV